MSFVEQMMDTFLIDSHAHFGTCVAEAGMSEEFLLDEMKKASVAYAVQVSTCEDDMDWSVAFARSHENIFCTLGIHPEYASDGQRVESLAEKVDALIASGGRKKLFGIGEIGLDYYWNKENRTEQIDLFEAQLSLAKKHNVPAVIHTRDAFDDTIDILKNAGHSRILLHCFSGSAAQAKICLDLGHYISFAGNVTYKKALDLQEAAAYVPADRLLLETDCPYLAPQAVRGQKNHPAFIAHTYEFVASLRKTDVASLAENIAGNFFTFIA
jgi:TatD DNase family protein